MIDNILPIRYPKKEIDLDIIKLFFTKNGEYPGKNLTIKEIGPVWQQVLNRWTNSSVDVFSAIENKDFKLLKEIYENYYIQGISEGASSGKAFSPKGNSHQYKLDKSKRNIGRALKLSNFLNLGLNDVDEIYHSLNKKFIIPKSPNYGQAWGWQYGDLFVNFELADYIYFLNTIQQVISQLNIKKTCFLGDGSGLLSTLVYHNCDISSSNHIDLSHFLIKQYLNNPDKNNINYLYAEGFKEDTKYEADILINQDSFPEMTDKSVTKYIKNIILNKVPYILSYNKEVIFEGGNPHSDFRSIIIKHGYNSMYRANTIMREGYVIELFGKN